MLHVPDQAEVFLDLRVADVVPVSHVRAVKLAEEGREIAFERNFLQRLPVFAAELQTALFGFGQKFAQRFIHVRDEFSLHRFLFGHGFGAELFKFGRFGFPSRSSRSHNRPV